MVRIISVENIKKVKKAVPLIEKKLKVHFTFNKSSVAFKGKELHEFLTERIIKALEFGFDIEDAMLLVEEDYILKFVNIKEHTHRRNLKDVRARVIGRKGKTIKTIENLSDCKMAVKDNKVGLIVNQEFLDITIQALESLIQGSKHGNIYSYLEKQCSKRHRDSFGDLGLKEDVKYLDYSS